MRDKRHARPGFGRVVATGSICLLGLFSSTATAEHVIGASASGVAAAGRLGGSGTISATGRVGPLQIDRSNRAAILAFAGQPTAERTGGSPGAPPYDALGYECSATASIGDAPLASGGPYCRTVFYINDQTGELGTFFTAAAHQYRESHGVRIGTTTATAERLLHMRLIAGCGTSIYLKTKAAFLTVAFTGGRARPPSLTVTGGHVYAFVLHSPRHYLGIFDCL